MEKATYRKNIEQLKEAFPNTNVLTITDVVRYTGLNVKTVKKRYKFDRYKTTTIANLAHEMAI